VLAANPAMTLPLRQVVKQVSAVDRCATDDSLQGERDKTDELLAQKNLATDALRETRDDAEATLEHVRAEVDTQLQADGLPAISEKLVHVADNLTAAAENLSAVAGDLSEAATHLSEAAHAAEAPEAPGEPEQTAPAIAEASRHLVAQLADIATGMAEITNNLSGERQEADQKLRLEREVTDRIIDQQLQQAEAVIDEHLGTERELLAAERTMTDADLAEERRHTDAAVGHVLDLLVQEQRDHAAVQKKFATRNEFLAIVSHDLRAPLATMSAAAALIWKTAPDDEMGQQIRTTTERLRRSVAIMERLISDLLDFASFEDGALQVRAEPQDVTILLNRSAEVFQPLASAQSLSLSVEVEGQPLMAKFDMDRMLQVLSNLLQNAIKFTPPGGSISIRAARKETACIIAVSDTGIGIPADELNSIFERFRQLGTSDRAGLGLGLYISKWIVEAHGGRIWAESRVNAGSTFYFTLHTG
jgi:signal transduction histidine kinase